MTLFLTCKDGCETILAREVRLSGGKMQTEGRGWIVVEWAETAPQPDLASLDFCFGYTLLKDPYQVSAASINSLTEQLIKLFLAHIEKMRITEPWPFQFSYSGNEQLLQRAKTVEKLWQDKLLKKMSRVAKLAKKGLPQDKKFAEGFFVHFIDFDHAFVSFQARSSGQQRMQMDPKAPSRSYLKIEEAFHLFGAEPQKKEMVVDLGAAPGGWSYSALKRGATVIAIDNGPLKGEAKSHPNLTHLKVDALKYGYNKSKPAEWLLCDILEKPDMILILLHKWLTQKWCRRFIVNLKVGRTDPIAILKQIKDPAGLLPYCKFLSMKQLYHDREEITLMGQLKD